MGRYRGPKHKLSRRFGVDIFGTGGASLARRLARPPGAQAGSRRRRRESDYAQQIREKQKAKYTYGLGEKQFRRYVREALDSNLPTGDVLLSLLERRLDNVVYRLGFARSRPQARQLVNHGHVDVNDRRTDIPSYRTSSGDRIRLRPSAHRVPDVEDLAQHGPHVPAWLQRADGGGRVLRQPQRDDAEPFIDPELLLQFYTR